MSKKDKSAERIGKIIEELFDICSAIKHGSKIVGKYGKQVISVVGSGIATVKNLVKAIRT